MKHFIKTRKGIKMNKKKIIILAILFVGIVCLALSPASADGKTYKTDKLYFKYNGDSKKPVSSFSKSIDSKTSVNGFYNYPKNINSQHSANYVNVEISGKVISYKQYKPNYKPSKIIVMFKKNENGKTYYSSKTFTKFENMDGYSYFSGYSPKNNYKPQYTIVYYKKI